MQQIQIVLFQASQIKKGYVEVEPTQSAITNSNHSLYSLRHANTEKIQNKGYLSELNSIFCQLFCINNIQYSYIQSYIILMNNRNYCCYRHFKQGKNNISCTYCNDHVLLGVINPPPNLQKKSTSKPNLNFDIRSKPFRIQNRTHDFNEIQNKDSLPDRLTTPKIYIEKIVSKGERNQILLPPRLSGSSQYQQTVRLFRKIGESLQKKSKVELMSLVKNYSFERKIIKNMTQNVFLTKTQFIQFAMSTFKSFTSQDADKFWNISYNQMRFRQKISMEAFVFNFGKFYLQMQNYTNMLSEAALRQRMIDLRYQLFDWANSYKALQYNTRQMNSRTKQLQSYLKMSQFQSILCDLQIAMSSIKKTSHKFHSISQMIFALTDRKSLPSKDIKQSVYDSISRDNNLILAMRGILTQFFEMNDLDSKQKFPITDILSFANTEKYSQEKIESVVRWTQNFFSFVYFQKWQSQLGVFFNMETKKLNCSNLLMVDPEMIKQFDRFLLQNYEEKVQISKILYSIIEEGLSRMPKIDGHKKKILQWNYMSQVLLRYIRSIDLTPFWRIYTAVSQSRQEISLELLQQRLKQVPSEEQLKKCLKKLFTFDNANDQRHKTKQRETEQSNEYNNDDLQNMLSLKQNQLVLKTRTYIQRPEIEQNQSIINQNCVEFDGQKNIGNIKSSSKQKIVEQVIKFDTTQMSTNSYLCPHFYKYSLDISRQTNQSISSIQTLQSRAYQLLNIGLGQQHQYKF